MLRRVAAGASLALLTFAPMAVAGATDTELPVTPFSCVSSALGERLDGQFFAGTLYGLERDDCYNIFLVVGSGSTFEASKTPFNGGSTRVGERSALIAVDATGVYVASYVPAKSADVLWKRQADGTWQQRHVFRRGYAVSLLRLRQDHWYVVMLHHVNHQPAYYTQTNDAGFDHHIHQIKQMGVGRDLNGYQMVMANGHPRLVYEGGNEAVYLLSRFNNSATFTRQTRIQAQNANRTVDDVLADGSTVFLAESRSCSGVACEVVFQATGTVEAVKRFKVVPDYEQLVVDAQGRLCLIDGRMGSDHLRLGDHCRSSDGTWVKTVSSTGGAPSPEWSGAYGTGLDVVYDRGGRYYSHVFQ